MSQSGDRFYYLLNELYQALSASTIPSVSGQSGKVLSNDGTNLLWITGGGGSGTVTSVGLTLPSIFSVTGSPITTSGTLAATLATQSANTVFAGPSSGSAAAPTFRALTQSDITSLIVNPLGIIINEPFTSSRANWTSNGNFTISGSTLQCASTASSLDLSNYISQNVYGGTNLEDWTITATITVGTVSSTSFGIGFGLQSINTTGPASIQIGILLDSTNGGKIGFYYNNSSSVNYISTSKITAPSAGNVLAVKIQYFKNKLVVTLTNTSTTPNVSITETLPISVSYPVNQFYLPNFGEFSIYALGGTHSVSNFIVSSYENVGSDWLVIADSISKGYYSNSADARWINKIQNVYNGKYTVYGQASNKTNDNNINEIVALNPKNILVDIGTNNIGYGQNLSTFNTNMAALISSLTSAGYVLGTNLFICTILPRNDYDVTSYNTSLRTTYAGAIIDQYYSFNASSGTGINSIYSDEGIHPNTIGHNKKADVIASGLGLTKKINYHQETTFAVIDPYTGYLGVGTNVPRYQLDVYDASNVQISVRNSTADSGGYIHSIASSFIYMFGGATYNGTNWIAKSTMSNGWSMGNGSAGLSVNTGLTVGSSFIPVTTIWSDTTGTVICNMVSPSSTSEARLWINESSKSGVKIGSDSYLSTLSASSLLISSGAYTNGSTWISKSLGYVALMAFNYTQISFFMDTVSPNTSFTPTERCRLTTTGLYLGGGVSASSLLHLADAGNITFGTTSGTKIGTSTSQKIGLWNTTPIVQPTTSIAAASFVANTSSIANDTATWDGYTIGQVVKGLRNIGILA
jgi:lysophospholipase L1-like esterase